MKRTVRYLLSMLAIFVWSTLTVKGQQSADTLCFFTTDSIMQHAERVAAYFMRTTPDVGANSYVGGKQRNSKIWTRGVFYEGLLNMYRQNPRADWLQYAIDWGDYHQWVSSSDNEAKNDNADYQCCGQSYLELYNLDTTQTIRMQHIKMRIENHIADTPHHMRGDDASAQPYPRQSGCRESVRYVPAQPINTRSHPCHAAGRALGTSWWDW